MKFLEQYLQAIKEGNLEKANKLFNSVIQTSSEQDLYDLAVELSELGFLQESAQFYNELLKSYPDEGELLIALAEIYIDLDQEEDAIAVLEQIQSDDPNYVAALMLQADLFQIQGLFEVSEQKLLLAEQLVPDEVVIQFALGELFASIGRFAEAIYKYGQVLKETDKIAGVSINHRLAETYSAAGDFENALKYFEAALEERLDINVLFGFGLTAYQAGYSTLAIQKLTEVIELDPDYESAYLPLARAYEQEEDLKNAHSIATTGTEVAPFNKEINFYAGKISLKLGDEDQAENYFRKAIKLDPAYIEAILTFNKLLLHQERYADLIELVEPILQNGEEDPEVLWDYAVACQEEERYSEALKAYRKAYIYFKEKEDFLQNYGFFVLEEGIYQEAIEIFTQLQKIDPTNVDYVDVLERLEGIEKF